LEQIEAVHGKRITVIVRRRFAFSFSFGNRHDAMMIV
jgi:hypothetical protein